jgi:hypothetical protein
MSDGLKDLNISLINACQLQQSRTKPSDLHLCICTVIVSLELAAAESEVSSRSLRSHSCDELIVSIRNARRVYI